MSFFAELADRQVLVQSEASQQTMAATNRKGGAMCVFYSAGAQTEGASLNLEAEIEAKEQEEAIKNTKIAEFVFGRRQYSLHYR